jgi:hypothetical protein
VGGRNGGRKKGVVYPAWDTLMMDTQLGAYVQAFSGWVQTSGEHREGPAYDLWRMMACEAGVEDRRRPEPQPSGRGVPVYRERAMRDLLLMLLE